MPRARLARAAEEERPSWYPNAVVVVVEVDVQHKPNSPQRDVLTMCDGFSHGGLAFTAHLWADGAAARACGSRSREGGG